MNTAFASLPQEPLCLDPAFVAGVRDVLDGAGFQETKILQRLRAEDSVSVGLRDLPRLLQLTRAGTPLDTFIRLFSLGASATEEAARQAVRPMTLEQWVDGGLLLQEDDDVVAPLCLAHHTGVLIAFDPPVSRRSERASRDVVPGPGRATLGLLSAVVRTPTGKALDVGTGCGIQAFLCARHARHVVATDINPRAVNLGAFGAALNGIDNIEFRLGNLFEPVQGERFDLIVMNPPFAISPETRFMYRDGGEKGDGFVERVVREAPALLEDAGLLQICAQWACLRDKPWPRRLQSWFAGAGCDVWVIQLENVASDRYAAKWIQDTEPCSRTEFVQKCSEWMAFYEREGIGAVGTGLITMRKRAAEQPWYFVSADVDGIGREAGEAVRHGLALRDFLSETTDDRRLLDTAFRLSPDTILETVSEPACPGWRTSRHWLRMTGGLHASGKVDNAVAELLSGCDGQTPLGELIANLATRANQPADQLASRFLPLAKALVERGYLLPPGIG